MSTLDDKLLEILENGDYDSSLLNVNIKKDIQNNLLDYQILHVQNLVGSIEKNKIAIDPGFGFGKNPVHNMQIMAWLPMFQTLGVPVLLGASRKSTIAALSNNEVANDRMAGSISLLCYANILGLQIIRVHDVFESNQALNISNYLNKQFELL